MKITKSQLRRIINEALRSRLDERGQTLHWSEIISLVLRSVQHIQADSNSTGRGLLYIEPRGRWKDQDRIGELETQLPSQVTLVSTHPIGTDPSPKWFDGADADAERELILSKEAGPDSLIHMQINPNADDVDAFTTAWTMSAGAVVETEGMYKSTNSKVDKDAGWGGWQSQ